MSPTGGIHGRLTAHLLIMLGVFVQQHDLGQMYGAGTGFKLSTNPDTVRDIDVACVSKQRLRPNTEEFPALAPDLAVEVVSPGNTGIEMQEKVEAYFRAGSRLVWVVYPRSRTVYVYRAANRVDSLHEPDSLEGADVLPGFSVKVAEIFSVLDSG